LFKNNIDNITPIENHKIVDFTNWFNRRNQKIINNI
jgi:hypothetical protein